MPATTFAGSINTPKVDVTFDLGNPFLNRTVDGFIKIGAVGVSKVAAEETYHFLQKGRVSQGTMQDSLVRMCKEGSYWGTVAGVYVGTQYGLEKVRGTRDWKNAMLGGAITGAVVSAASNKHTDQVIKDAITGGALATAAEFLSYLA